MARLLGALGRLGSDKKRPSSMQPLKSGETLEQKLGDAVSKGDPQKSGALKPPPGKGPGGKDMKVFGVPIDDLLARTPGLRIPQVVTDLIDYLRLHGLSVDGIFRVPGDNNELQRLKAAYDSGVPVDLEAATDVHGAASLLKHYFRDLPDPALTFAFYPTLVALHTHIDPNHRLEQTRRIITKSLPESHRNVLEILIEFLVEVASHSGTNKMDTGNLAKVFGPTLLRPETDNMVQMLEDARYVLSIVRMLLDEFAFIFGRNNTPKGTELVLLTSVSDPQLFGELKEDIKDRLQKKGPAVTRIQGTDGNGRTRSSSLSDVAPAQAAAAARLAAIPAPAARSATPTPDKGRRKALNMKVEIPQGSLSELLSSPELLLSPGRGPNNKDEMFAKLESKDEQLTQAIVPPAAATTPPLPSLSVYVPTPQRSPSPNPMRSVPLRTPSPSPSRSAAAVPSITTWATAAAPITSPTTSPLSSPREAGPMVSKIVAPRPISPMPRPISPHPREGENSKPSERSSDPRLAELVAAMTSRLVAERAEDRRPAKIEDMSPAQLKAEEVALKRELTNYDRAFADMFGEPPKREDRFPLKPLAERYKAVLTSLGMPAPSKAAMLKTSSSANSSMLPALASNPQYMALVKRKNEAKAAIDTLQRDFEAKHGGRRPETNDEKLPFAPLLKSYLDVKAEMGALEETLVPKQPKQ